MTQNIEPTALTIRIPQSGREFSCDVAVCEAFDPDSGGEHPPWSTYTGIWDTGASGSVITKKVIEDLGLQSINRAEVSTAAGVRESDVYLVNIALPSQVGFKGLRVTDGDIRGVDVLIGMDIIGLGDFAITHESEGDLVMSYRTPPDWGRVTDFVKQINSRKPMERSRSERLRGGNPVKRHKKRRRH